ncbi:hypothetical protein E4U42_003782 [Claviceps africana]|uniref:RNase III domain-containing protein n=1 Tax=Claviceps africana TaxID=83212 RepID=A0A8K0NIK8_9HYPO|nr:hypothetical protein E4U42_003782 [Claviceps africana]
MALQPTRAVVRTRQTLRCLLRGYTSEASPTPKSFTIAESSPSAPRSPPRWSQTPAGMKAPFQLDHALSPHNKIWSVNNDPGRLDDMYNRLLGPGGSRMLPEELKWLAVTHKSFDQGRRGFNDKLALMGRLALVMEATKDIVSRAPLQGSRQTDGLPRRPFEHDQLAAVDNLSVAGPKDVVGKEKLYGLAKKVGLQDVVRWKPRLPDQLETSGVEVVLNGAIMAIIGAITLQHGSVVATTVVRERILPKLPKN